MKDKPTTSYNQRSNGIVERVHQVVVNQIEEALVEEEEVNKIEEAVVTETSKASICPFRLIFGRTCSVIHLVGHSKPNDSRTV